MKVLFVNRFNDYWEKKYLELKNDFTHCEFVHLTDSSLRIKYLSDADVVVSGRLSEEEIKAARKLKIIFVPFTGLNTFPVEKIKQRGIIISNTHANAPYVAERAVAMALSMLGRVGEFHEELKHGHWKRLLDENNMWTSIYRMNCGIVGYGNIGRNIAKILKIFECSVLGFRRSNVSCMYAEITNDLEKLVSESVLIFVCLPETDSTKDLISKDLLMKMYGKYLVNVGRGSTVNEEALYLSLKQGILKGAAIDVWYKYPRKHDDDMMPSEFPFWELNNVLLSPHKSSHTEQAIKAMIDDTCENIRTYLTTGKPKSIAIF